MSKYALLIYGDYKRWEDLGEDEQNAIMGEHYAYSEALVDAGVMAGGEALQAPETAKTVAKNNVVTDGPFADVAEHLGGFYLVEVDSLDEALEWGGRIPEASRGLGRVEVRPVQEFPDAPSPDSPQ